MKKLFFNPCAAMGLFFSIVLIGCKKDVLLPPEDYNNTASIRVHNLHGFIISESNTNNGSVAGKILPVDARPRVYLFGNSTYELSVDNNGVIRQNSIPAGEYSVYIVPDNLDYLDHYIDIVVVRSGTTLNIGTVILQYSGFGGGAGCEVGWGRIGFR